MRGSVALRTCIVLFLITAVLPAGGDGTYTVKAGDSLFAIARTQGVPVDILVAYNNITNVSRLKVGTVIRVPATYTVKKGDTLYGIAKSLSITMGELLTLNGLQQDSVIKAGRVLFLPAGAVATASSSGASATGSVSATGGAGTVVSATGSGTATTGAGATGQAGGTTGASSAATQPQALGTMEVVWPHPGKHVPEKGKLWWLVFQGADGDVVHSATAGEVKWAATWWGYGKVVIIKSANGATLVYGGNRELLVKVGDRVEPGTEIAKLGASIQGGGTRLYFSVNDANDKAMDPEKFFSVQSQS
jgi:murein DD-endopeptidase MepM/ murein hydrolase activator NlpD